MTRQNLSRLWYNNGPQTVCEAITPGDDSPGLRQAGLLSNMSVLIDVITQQEASLGCI